MTTAERAATGRLARVRGSLSRHPVAVTLTCTLLVTAAIVYGLWDKRDDFTTALGDASWWVLALAVALQVVWLVFRSEAWHVCVDAAGGAVERRRLYRASAVGYLGNLFNSHIGVGVRIAALRRSAPAESPPISVLIAAEMPIIVVELALAAICSFTLVATLGIPWWLPIVFLGVAALVVGGITRLAKAKRDGIWAGLGVMRGLSHRNRIIALTMLATGAQVLRNWLVLRGLGVDVGVLDSIALLIGTAAVGLLPIGPTVGVATSVLILGSNGVALAAAAGALLTATGAVGALCFATWALADRLRDPLAKARAASRQVPAEVAVAKPVRVAKPVGGGVPT